MPIKKRFYIFTLIFLFIGNLSAALANPLTETRVSHGRLVRVEIPEDEAAVLQAVFDQKTANIVWFDFGVGIPKADFQNQDFSDFLKTIGDEFAVNPKSPKAFIDIEDQPQSKFFVNLVCKAPGRLSLKVNVPEANVAIICSIIHIEGQDFKP